MTDAKQKECWSCGSKISSSSRICPECKAAQDWRRQIDMLAPLMVVLSLITALASVLSMAIPVFRDMARSSGADMKLIFLDAGSNTMQFIIQNEGRMAAVVREASLTTREEYTHGREKLDETTESLQWHLLPEASETSQKYIKPGETALMTLRVESGYDHFPKLLAVSGIERTLESDEWVLDLVIDAVQPNGKTQTVDAGKFVGFNTWVQ